MIVSEIMTTKLVTVNHDDTLSHAANLFRQYQFHHLPVVRTVRQRTNDVIQTTYTSQVFFEGLLTSQDIDLVVAVAKQSSSGDILHHPWQEQRVMEVMHRASIRVTPNTSVAAAAQILVERGLNALPVVEYEHTESETKTLLVGLLTRSDLLIALARSMGAYEPGMELLIQLPMGDLKPLAQTLLLASELHVQIRSILASPLEGNVPRTATLRLGTINPAPLLVRLQEAAVEYTFAEPLMEDSAHD
ncbi:MAG: CBS domain-containing protein [Ktedonobacteraceae bacterium]